MVDDARSERKAVAELRRRRGTSLPEQAEHRRVLDRYDLSGGSLGGTGAIPISSWLARPLPGLELATTPNHKSREHKVGSAMTVTATLLSRQGLDEDLRAPYGRAGARGRCLPRYARTLPAMESDAKAGSPR